MFLKTITQHPWVLRILPPGRVLHGRQLWVVTLASGSLLVSLVHVVQQSWPALLAAPHFSSQLGMKLLMLCKREANS